MVEMDPSEVGRQIQELRERAKLGLRELSRMAGLSPAALSAIEKGKSSPTLATLHKMLRALGTDFSHFFAHEPKPVESPVFSTGQMQVVEDPFRKYRFLLPKREDFRFEMLVETIAHTEKEPEWELHDCDFGGMVLSGGPMRLEIEGQGAWEAKEGDAFYVTAGLRHRGINLGSGPMQLITVLDPPRY